MTNDLETGEPEDRDATDAEKAIVLRRAFEAAYEVVRTVEINQTLTNHAVVATTFKAMIAAWAAVTDATKGISGHCYVDVTHITASAWCLHLTGDVLDTDEWSPESVAGGVLTGFASACLLLKAHHDFDYATNYYHDEPSSDTFAQAALDALPDDEADDD